MSQATDTDLTRLTDDELDAALQVGFNKFAEAKKAGDKRSQARCRAATDLILAEQGRRLDGWLDHTLGVQ